MGNFAFCSSAISKKRKREGGGDNGTLNREYLLAGEVSAPLSLDFLPFSLCSSPLSHICVCVYPFCKLAGIYLPANLDCEARKRTQRNGSQIHGPGHAVIARCNLTTDSSPSPASRFL